MKITLLPAFLLAAGAALAQSTEPTPAPSEAPQVEERFASWVGCWRLEDDPADTDTRLCITPDGPGVRLQTIIGGELTAEEALRGDGIARPIEEADCKGTERAEWSKDGRRLFRETEVTCGAEGSRSVSGIAFFAPGPTWVNVQMAGGGDARMLRVQRYRRTRDRELPDGTRVRPLDWTIGSAPSWDVGDVIEASRRMPAEVVQAAITEARGRYALDRRSLIALADAGVPELTIDVMIGLTYPKHFAVQRGEASPVESDLAIASGSYGPLFYWGSSYGGCYSHYGYRSYYNDPGCVADDYDYWYSSGAGNEWVPVEPGPPVATERGPRGFVVNGRGYTQVVPRDDGPSGSGGGGGSGADSSGGLFTGSSGTSDTSSASSSGYSSGSSNSSSGDSGRVAVDRPPNDR